MIPTATEILRGAIRAVEINGHTRRQRHDPSTGSLCAVGALDLAAGLRTMWTDIYGHRTNYAVPSPVVRYDDYVYIARVSAELTKIYEAIEPHLPDFFTCTTSPVLFLKEEYSSFPHTYLIIWNDVACDGGEELILVFKKALADLESETA